MALQVSLVSADAEVWTGEAKLVVATTTAGQIGFMAGHEPVLAILGDGPVRITQADDGSTVPLKDTIESFDAIARGDFDHVAEQAFFNVGPISDVEENWARIQKENG